MATPPATPPRKCPCCAGGQTEPFLDKNRLRLVRCGQCRMVFVPDPPSDYVTGEYYDQQGQSFYLSTAKLESDYAPVRFARELRLFRKHCTTGRVLDVGCSSGAFLWQLSHQYPGTYEVTGTDVSGPPLDYAESRGVPVVRGDFLAHDFGAARFDTITFWAVLEHVAEPRRFLRRAAELLRSGGVCVVLVPNLRSLAARCLGGRYRYIYPQHLNYWTADTLVRTLPGEFEVAELRSTHFNPVVIWQDWRGGGREVSNAERAALLQRTTRYKTHSSMRSLRLAYGLVEAALGKVFLADNLVAVLRRRPASGAAVGGQ